MNEERNSLTMIWDLDGTLLDSYEVIVATLYKTYKEYGIELDKEYILREVITYYVGDQSIDIECAENARVRSILFLPEYSVAVATGRETHIVKDLMEIKDIL
jgi:phosphoglycolate phosphatase-like HAD superfamily hydrolase